MNITQKARDEIHDLIRANNFGKVVAYDFAHTDLLDKIVHIVEKHQGDLDATATVSEAVP